MSHIVKCRYCGEQLDTDKTKYIEDPSKWYYHTECYDKKQTLTQQKIKNNAQSIKKCYYCGKELNISTEEFGKPVINRYAHKLCMQQNYKEDDIYIDEIYKLLKEKIHMAYNYQVCEKQRINYIKQGYNNKGIYLALEYWYIIKNNTTDKANGAIGIVPYVYSDAQHYYDELEKRQNIINKSLQKELKKEHIKINISLPETLQKRKLINLDDIFQEKESDELW